MRLKELLAQVVQQKASDSSDGRRVCYDALNGDIVNITDHLLTEDEIRKFLSEIVDSQALKDLDACKELNVSFMIDGLSRFRLNAFYEKGLLGAAIRIVLLDIPKLDTLGVPLACRDLITKPNGLVLITGASGMGKTTTMAAMIDYINRNGKSSRIVTIEDPIEYLHKNDRSVIIQREVGTDTSSFAEALRQALRQDPNIICVGEMRDVETISTALTAAETGHLVFGALHTQDAAQTINRIVDVFPAGQQEQVRVQLAYTLQGIICQKLIPRADGKGRALACEVLIANAPVRNIIRKMDFNQLANSMIAGADCGMITMDKSLKRLVEAMVISHETALEYARNPKDFKFI